MTSVVTFLIAVSLGLLLFTVIDAVSVPQPVASRIEVSVTPHVSKTTVIGVLIRLLPSFDGLFREVFRLLLWPRFSLVILL